MGDNGKVLLVDDNQIVRETISATLEMFGHEAIEELRRCVNSQFDSTVVQAFVAALSNEKKANENSYQAALQIDTEDDQKIQ